MNLFPPVEHLEFNLYSYAGACIKELLVGFTMGFVTTMFFSIVMQAGQIIDINIGFSMVQLFDPQLGTQVPLTGNLLNIVMLLSFFMTNGHHMLIRILANSFTIMPPGNFTLNADVAMVVVETFILTFVMGVRIAMPVMAAIFITEVALGIVIRTVPQMNMFVIGIPLKIVLGLVTLVLIIPVFMQSTNHIFVEMFNAIENIFLGMVST